ncbi:uncharacterized protein [Drosophila pseudoobscura]|uniref:Uncharacterized protein n=1 Tax=Drosophila pseudoobscura pseudoobscura TaxID=46245 RepID=A0A6I8V3G5_DROPS|nr:uncharacterized protein LOC6897930 [Drosophila pseudoobscura]
MLLIRAIVLMHLVILARCSLKQNVTLAQIVSGSATKQQANATAAVEVPTTAMGTTASAVHFRRVPRKVVDIPVIGLDFETSHKPCDMEMRGIRRYISAFPNQCIWSFNNRYTTEGYYRVYKMFQLEAFFFGQYHERLKRYETEPHNYKEA